MLNELQMSRLAGMGMAIVATIGGLVLFGSFYYVWFAKTSESWPTISGNVTHSAIVNSQSVSQTESGTRVREHYELVLRFEYHLQGQAYESDRYTIYGEKASTSRLVIEQALKNYPVGKEVLVYYNPEEPGVGVLEPGARLSFRGVFVMWIAGIFFVGPVIFFMPERLKKKFIPMRFFDRRRMSSGGPARTKRKKKRR